MRKYIVCFCDSNIQGSCADPGDRFNEEERHACLPQKQPAELLP